LFALIIAVFLAWPQAGHSKIPPDKATSNPIYIIPIDDDISMGMAAFVRRAVSDVKKSSATAVIFEIDTFGGRVDAALKIVSHIESLQGTASYAFVLDKAWSAGALISLACDKIYMKPGSSIGSAAPVSGESGKELSEKHVSALRAKFRGLAEKNGYPPNLAAAMVDKDMEVHRVISQGKNRFLTPDEIKDLKRRGKITSSVSEVITEKGKLLNLAAEQSKKYDLAADIVDSPENLHKIEDWTKPPIVRIERSALEKVAGILTGGMLSSLLLMLGMILLSSEMKTPGFGWLGITGLIFIIAVLWGHYIVDLAQLMDMILIFAGLTLLAIEIFAIPGFGVFGISGIACILTGLYLMFIPFTIPKEPWEFARLIEVLWILTAGLLGAIVISLVLFIYLIPKLPMFSKPRRIEIDESAATEQVQISEEELSIGEKGLSATAIAPFGTGQFSVHIIDVASEGETIPRGSTIEIVRFDTGKAVVRESKS
ncbi:nodulation protein NfeD, partial [Elusimicrobiota bacterium]